MTINQPILIKDPQGATLSRMPWDGMFKKTNLCPTGVKIDEIGHKQESERTHETKTVYICTLVDIQSISQRITKAMASYVINCEVCERTFV